MDGQHDSSSKMTSTDFVEVSVCVRVHIAAPAYTFKLFPSRRQIPTFLTPQEAYLADKLNAVFYTELRPTLQKKAISRSHFVTFSRRLPPDIKVQV